MLLDEMESWNPEILLALNESTSAPEAAFPDGYVQRGDNYIIGTGNTSMRGGNTQYVRHAHDISCTDRFTFIEIGYNLEWEKATFNVMPEWTNRCQWLRAKVQELHLHDTFMVSPRAMIKGAALINAGFTQCEVEQMVVLKGAKEDAVTKLYQAAGKPSKTGSKINNIGSL